MKLCRICTVGVLMIILSGVCPSFAQAEYEDVVYLKDGAVRRGLIIELIPGESVKIETRYGEIFIISMSDISKITKEEREVFFDDSGSRIHNTDRRMSNVKLETWYTYWGFGYAAMTYTHELDLFYDEFERACLGCDRLSLNFDFFGFYWPLKNNQTIVGGVYNASGDRYTYGGNWMQATSGQVSISAMHFLKVIGEGLFLRADLGLGSFDVEVHVDGETYDALSDWAEGESGLAGLFGVGYAIPVGGGGTRVLFNVNYAMRPGIELYEPGYATESGNVRALNFTLGGLF